MFDVEMFVSCVDLILKKSIAKILSLDIFISTMRAINLPFKGICLCMCWVYTVFANFCVAVTTLKISIYMFFKYHPIFGKVKIIKFFETFMIRKFFLANDASILVRRTSIEFVCDYLGFCFFGLLFRDSHIIKKSGCNLYYIFTYG